MIEKHPVLIIFQILVLTKLTISLRDRIIGGKLAPPGKFPGMVSLRFTGEHICGGSILSMTHILTAAHCFEGTKEISGPDASYYTIMVGDTYREKNKRSPDTRQMEKASKIISHQNYDVQTDFYDIALILLLKPLTENSNVKPIILPKSPPVIGANCSVIGFGVKTNNSEDFNPSDRLLEADVNVLKIEECMKDALGKINPKIMICAGNLKEGKDSCQGDSGGPLFCGGILCGIVSFGAGCADDDNPGVYTFVYEFLDWIANTQKQLSDDKGKGAKKANAQVRRIQKAKAKGNYNYSWKTKYISISLTIWIGQIRAT